MNWLVTALYGYQREDRDALVRACAEGKRPTGIPQEAAAMRQSGETPYPLEEIRRIGRMYNSSMADRTPGGHHSNMDRLPYIGLQQYPKARR